MKKVHIKFGILLHDCPQYWQNFIRYYTGHNIHYVLNKDYNATLNSFYERNYYRLTFDNNVDYITFLLKWS